jgi:hypothetical protein
MASRVNLLGGLHYGGNYALLRGVFWFYTAMEAGISDHIWELDKVIAAFVLTTSESNGALFLLCQKSIHFIRKKSVGITTILSAGQERKFRSPIDITAPADGGCVRTARN